MWILFHKNQSSMLDMYILIYLSPKKIVFSHDQLYSVSYIFLFMHVSIYLFAAGVTQFCQRSLVMCLMHILVISQWLLTFHMKV